jgi:excisionase family DNA binding protein
MFRREIRFGRLGRGKKTPLKPLAYRVSDFCEQIGVCKSTFWKLRAAGKIRTIKIGSRVLVPADEVERILKEGV